ncbi:HesB/YadR/YfhF family protein [Virgibacillus senegalensis]|uniref:HesB/YadR/YfhF family protein n=1 Tax=Virgibacillus senegalensis TaxID=1499679 RepID=UPI00069E944B|nr:HesB/YadR/YfhF family protein [Virgibacillus senegalensis]
MISITQPAAKWYINELDLAEGAAVRFYARYGGHGGVHRGFSLALSIEQPNNPAFSTEASGITFYVEESDAWYFEGHDFHIKYKRKYDEVEFVFVPSGPAN